MRERVKESERERERVSKVMCVLVCLQNFSIVFLNFQNLPFTKPRTGKHLSSLMRHKCLFFTLSVCLKLTFILFIYLFLVDGMYIIIIIICIIYYTLYSYFWVMIETAVNFFFNISSKNICVVDWCDFDDDKMHSLFFSLSLSLSLLLLLFLIIVVWLMCVCG